MCSEGARLNQLFLQAETAFEQAVAELHRQVGRRPRAEYLSLSRHADQAWAKVQQARASLDKHFREHSCRTAAA